MEFYQKNKGEIPDCTSAPGFYLIRDHWNDFFEYRTMFDLYYVASSQVKYIGKVKIAIEDLNKKVGDVGLVHDDLEIPDKFSKLSEKHYSVGQDSDYYNHLINLGQDVASECFVGLRDIAYDNTIFSRYENERAMYMSLLRDISKASVTGQYARIAHGGARLTPFKFKFKQEKSNEIIFDVDPNTLPPSNIQVIIGRNGVGKSYLLQNMVSSLLSNKDVKNRYFKTDGKNMRTLFAGVVGISFSAFDEALPSEDIEESADTIKYKFVGIRDEKNCTKNLGELSTSFFQSLEQIKKSNKKKRWLDAISNLEKDSVFNSMDVKHLINLNDEDFKEPKELEEYIEKFFRVKLSSGHKIVLLIITKLVELVEEKTLVLIDEPENHLHPPLLSAFTRSLSDLLVNRNGVAIVATHSPVILQEVPRDSVWILRRQEDFSRFERPRIQTFGENTGILTREVFGLELTDSGYHDLLKNKIDENSSYEEIVKKFFNDKLGSEAKAIVRELIYYKGREK